MSDDTYAKWLADNAHYGREKLAAALGCSTTYVSTSCRRYGVDITAAKRAKGLRRNDTPDGMPPEPPERPTLQHKTAATLDTLTSDERGLAYRLEAARQENIRLKRDNAQLMADQGERDEALNEVLAAVKARDPLPVITPFYTPRKKRSPLIAMLQLSDWHIGEVVSPDVTSSWGGYSLAIAKERVARLIERFLHALDDHRGFEIAGIWIPILGDMISGGIHHELEVSNEFPVPVQQEEAATLEADCIRHIARYGKVPVTVDHLCTGNHARRTKKPSYKFGGRNNDEWTVARMLQLELRTHTNVTVNRHAAASPLVKVGGWNFMLEHGAGYRSYFGQPYYAMMRGIMQEARKRMMEAADPLHYLLMGHFHVASDIEDTICVTGSLMGCTELDNAFKRYSPPKQCYGFIGKRGLCDWTPMRLDKD